MGLRTYGQSMELRYKVVCFWEQRGTLPWT